MRVQTKLFALPTAATTHGGDRSRGLRKTRRPIVVRRGRMHLVLRSARARGAWSLLHPRHVGRIETILAREARQNGVNVERYANVGNHLHLLVRATNRAGFQNFLRAVTALIARTVTGARRGRPVGRFWDGLAFSRCITSPRDLRLVVDYVIANKIEATQGPAARAEFLKSRTRFAWRRPRKKIAPD